MVDEEYMKIAIELGKKGAGFTNPNPLVGAVIVKNGKIIGQGYHEKYGQLHAERNALLSCCEDPAGATIYVTLEPCCHYGKTPPCTEAIIENKLSKVVIGSRDPNPLVAGKGVEILKKAGIKVTEDFMKNECDEMNKVFFHYISTKTPYVVMKYAMTMDGKIATVTGLSRWITGPAARENVHRDRHRYSGIMVGIGTVLKDNPLLTCRLPKGKNPVRIIADTNLISPLDSNLATTTNIARTIIATAVTDKTKQQPYLEKNCTIIEVPLKDGHLDLSFLMKKLGEEKIDSILLEGGGTLNFSALKAGIVNKVSAYIAPKIFGGSMGKTPVGGQGIPFPDQCIKLDKPKIKFFQEDILIESEVVKCSQE